jgi:teichoic acid transport system ATP-binding protein
MSNTIEVQNVSKVYHLYSSQLDRLKETMSPFRKKYHRDFFALDRVNLHVQRGETVGIVGKNGAGKSTLLKIITGVLAPTSGNVIVNGRISALLELGAGFNPEYTGMQNIYLSGTIMGYSKKEIDEKLYEITEFAEIGDYIHQPVKSYSSGMFMRLAFAIAINVDPEILIVDEALSVGDIMFQAKCFRKFQQFKDNGKTILFVSHSLSSILQYCDRVVVLHKGKLFAEGEPGPMVDLYKQLLVSNIDDNSVNFVSSEAKQKIVWKESLLTSRNAIEYGNRKAEIFDFGIFDVRGNLTSILESSHRFEVRIKIIFHEEIVNPIFAVTIKDVKGVELTGSNTLFSGLETGTWTQGSVAEEHFIQKLPMPGDGYFVSLGCTGYEKNEFVVYHRMYDIIQIQFINDQPVVGFFDMCSEIIINKKS